MSCPKLSRDNQVLYKDLSSNIYDIFLDKKLCSTLWLIYPAQEECKTVELYIYSEEISVPERNP